MRLTMTPSGSVLAAGTAVSFRQVGLKSGYNGPLTDVERGTATIRYTSSVCSHASILWVTAERLGLLSTSGQASVYHARLQGPRTMMQVAAITTFAG